MLKYSTQNSANQNNITILAIFESVSAIAFSITIAVFIDSLVHVLVGAVIAPLLLFRSKRSTDLGVQLFSKWMPESSGTERYIYGTLPRMLWVIILSVIIKIMATLRFPIEGLKVLPKNWFRTVFCTDFYTPTEIIPGTGPASDIIRTRVGFSGEKGIAAFFLIVIITVFVFIISIAVIRSSETTNIKLVLLILVPSIILLFYCLFHAINIYLYFFAIMAGYLYRISLKSTALIWLPLIYLADISNETKTEAPERIRELKSSALWRLTVNISWITLILLAVKMLVLPQTIDVWNRLPASEILNIYVMPNTLHAWHVAAGFNALLAIAGYYFFIDPAPDRLKAGNWSVDLVHTALKAFRLTRGTISIYTIGVGIYLTAQAVPDLKLPHFDWGLIPVADRT